MKFFFFLLPLIVLAKDDFFITKYEYGKMLYNNPRGISCKKCHGKNAKGLVITRFKHIVKNITHICEVKTPDITQLTFKQFKNKLNPNHKIKTKITKGDICKKLTFGNIMPKYYLSDDELNSLFFYIKNIRKTE